VIFMSIKFMFRFMSVLLFGLLLFGCQVQEETPEVEDAEADTHSVVQTPKDEIDVLLSPITLNPAEGQEIGTVFEAFLTPHQEGGEEEDTPAAVPDVFKSTAPSVSRDERPSQGHGVLTFTRDLSKAYAYIAIENVNPEEIVMFHIHCGRPGQLGPIIIDFSLMGDLQTFWEDGVLTVELTNADIEAVTDHGEGMVGAFTAGCPITSLIPLDKVKTIAGLETIAREGELYFNLHTEGQTFFGDIRGQLHQVNE
jgi:hypothetical protein